MDCCDIGYNTFSGNKEYGEKCQFDPEFKGPKSQRSPTDVYWLVAYFVFAAVWLTMGLYVLLHGSNNSSQLVDIAEFNINPADFPLIFEYLKKTLWCYLTTIFIATVISFTLIYVLRWVPTPVVWFSIFVMIAIFSTVAIAGFVIYFSNKSLADLNPKANDNAVAGLWLGIPFTIITIINVALVYFLREKIKFVITLIKEAGQAVSSCYSIVFFPIIPLIFQICILAISTSVAMNIEFVGSRDDIGIQYALHLLNIFGSLWTYWFVGAFQTMVFAHTFSTWYWTFDKRNLPHSALSTAVLRTTRYHLGTAAFGSLIITIGHIICYTIKAVLNQRHMRLLNICCANITAQVERLLKYLSSNAYIMVAIYGNPFCKSMRDALNLLMRNIVNVYVTNRVVSMQFALFNIAIAAGMGGLTYIFLPKADIQPNLIQYPICISVIGSFIVSSTFFGVYSMAIDTLFLCFLEDCERNDGSKERPYYMSATLMRALLKDSKNLLPLRQGQA